MAVLLTAPRGADTQQMNRRATNGDTSHKRKVNSLLMELPLILLPPPPPPPTPPRLPNQVEKLTHDEWLRPGTRDAFLIVMGLIIDPLRPAHTCCQTQPGFFGLFYGLSFLLPIPLARCLCGRRIFRLHRGSRDLKRRYTNRFGSMHAEKR